MLNPKFIILIPTFDRVGVLNLCLGAIEHQTVKPDQVVVVVRKDDFKTKKFLESKKTGDCMLNFMIIEVSEPGYIPPVVAGLNFAVCDYVGLIDDDILINKTWIENVINIFHKNSPRIGAITGAAICVEQKNRNVYPAKLTWYGRFSSVKNNMESSENINAVAECNVVFRGEAIKNLKIERSNYFGNIQHHGLDIGLQMKKRGWLLKYCSQINGKHLPRENKEEEYEQNVLNYVGNLVYVIKKNLSLFFLVRFALYNFLIGQHYFPGLATSVFSKNIRMSLVLKVQATIIHEILLKT